VVFVSLPSGMLKVMMSVANQKIVAVEIARLFWDSGVSTLAFPFSVAVLVVLYRALVPPRDPADEEARVAPNAPTGNPADPNAVPVPTKGETITTTSPYSFE